MERIGIVGIIVKNNKEAASAIQDLLTEYSDIIIGRMGVPCKDCGVSAISVIVKGTNEQISALAGKIGKISGVSVKSAVVSAEIEKNNII